MTELINVLKDFVNDLEQNQFNDPEEFRICFLMHTLNLRHVSANKRKEHLGARVYDISLFFKEMYIAGDVLQRHRGYYIKQLNLYIPKEVEVVM